MSTEALSTMAPSAGVYGPLLKRSLARSLRRSAVIVAGIFALAAGPALVSHPAAVFHALAHVGSLHAPDLTPIARASTAIQIHLATILSALAVTGVLLFGVKGALLHRVLGWGWAVAMVATAVSAFFIKAAVGPTVLGFGVLHIFAVITLVSVPRAVLAARRHDVAAHAAAISGFVIGGLGIAGLAAFLPGRLMWAVFFG